MNDFSTCQRRRSPPLFIPIQEKFFSGLSRLYLCTHFALLLYACLSTGHWGGGRGGGDYLSKWEQDALPDGRQPCLMLSSKMADDVC